MKRQTCNKFSEVPILSKKIKLIKIFEKRKGAQTFAMFKLEAGSNSLQEIPTKRSPKKETESC